MAEFVPPQSRASFWGIRQSYVSVASLVGMAFLVLLMAVALKNDVDRRWDVIVSQVRELLG